MCDAIDGLRRATPAPVDMCIMYALYTSVCVRVCVCVCIRCHSNRLRHVAAVTPRGAVQPR